MREGKGKKRNYHMKVTVFRHLTRHFSRLEPKVSQICETICTQVYITLAILLRYNISWREKFVGIQFCKKGNQYYSTRNKFHKLWSNSWNFIPVKFNTSMYLLNSINIACRVTISVWGKQILIKETQKHFSNRQIHWLPMTFRQNFHSFWKK